MFQNIHFPVLWKHLNTNRKFNSPTSVICLQSTSGQKCRQDCQLFCFCKHLCRTNFNSRCWKYLKQKQKKLWPLLWESWIYPVTSHMPHNPVSQNFILKILYFSFFLSHVSLEMLKGILTSKVIVLLQLAPYDVVMNRGFFVYN